MEDQCVIARQVRVAAGVFAPGHLGELTQIVPFEMVDAALTETASTRRRVRLLPARVIVYLLLAGCLFAEVGYRQVCHKLTAGLTGLAGLAGLVANPSENALWQARARLGVRPLRWLFDLLRGPAATAANTAGVRWRGLLVCAIDGTTMAIPDGARNLTGYTKQAGNHGGSGIRCCGWWPWWPAAPARSSTRSSDRPAPVRPATPGGWPAACAQTCSYCSTAASTTPG